MKHCQRKVPPAFGVVKLNVTTVCGAFASPSVLATHGEVPHRLLFSWYVVTEAIGTFRPRPGMAKVCCTEQSAHVPNTEIGCEADIVLPLKYWTFSTPPSVPVTRPQVGLRSGVQPS